MFENEMSSTDYMLNGEKFTKKLIKTFKVQNFNNQEKQRRLGEIFLVKTNLVQEIKKKKKSSQWIQWTNRARTSTKNKFMRGFNKVKDMVKEKEETEKN